MKNIFYTFFFLTSYSLGASAQQLPILSEYFHSPALLNPAMVGWEDITAITATYRHQWTGMPGNPITANLNFRHFSSQHNMAFGGGLMHDQTGPTSFTGLSLQYAYHLRFKPEKDKQEKRNRLAIGLSLSAYQYRLQGSKLKYNDANDALIVNNNKSKILPDAGLGLFYYSDQYFVGLSIPQVISLKVKFESDNALSAIQRIAHFYFNAGVKINIRDKSQGTTRRSLHEKNKHVLVPSIWIKYAPTSPLNFRATARYIWNQVLGIGLGASTDGTMLLDINVHIKKRFRVGYAFSVPLGLTNHIGSNHEIMLTYILGSNGKGWLFEKVPQLLGKKKEKNNF